MTAGIARSTTVVVHIWTCRPKKKELQPRRRQTCFGLLRLRSKLNAGNKLGTFPSQIFTFTQRPLLSSSLSRTSDSSTTLPPSPANLVFMMLAISPSGPVRYHCKWQDRLWLLQICSQFKVSQDWNRLRLCHACVARPLCNPLSLAHGLPLNCQYGLRAPRHCSQRPPGGHWSFLKREL